MLHDCERAHTFHAYVSQVALGHLDVSGDARLLSRKLWRV